MITIDQFKAFAPLVKDAKACNDLLAAINSTFEKRNINTLRRIRFFMTQAAFETAGFTKFTESMYYSTPERLVAVWPTRFTMDKENKKLAYAPDYVKNEAKLSNFIYANRNGNGNEASGDGFKYRGRGGFHLTFKNNYRDCSTSMYGDLRLVDSPDLVLEPEAAIGSAGWFWDTHQLNTLADKDEFTETTRVINGSAVTAPERLKVLKVANSIFV